MSRATWSTVCAVILAEITLAGTVCAAEVIPWVTDYRQAAEVAAREHKLVLLHFWSDDCPPCRRLEANVFPRKEVAAAMAASYIPVKVHVDRAPELARRYQVTRWPTDVVVTPTGLEVYRTVSPQDPARYAAMLADTAARSGAALARSENAAQASQSAAMQPVGYNASRPGATAPANHSSEFQPPVIEQGVPQSPPGAYGSRPAEGQQPMSSGNMTQNGPYQPSPMNAPTASRYGSEYSPGGVASPTTGSANMPLRNSAYASEYGSGEAYGSSPPPSAPAMPGYGASQQPPMPQQTMPPRPPENPYAAQPSRGATPPTAEHPEAHPGVPPLGMEGYCVVTLAEEVKWKHGDKRFGAIHRGRLYLFLSAEAQKKFLADPDRYSPVLSGYDPVQFAESGRLVEGKRAHGLTYNDQVYLFADEESLKKFQASPRPFADTVYQAMLKSDNASKYR
jgi:thiol-disulfide isomerase/thioredoxin/YHS domain-containing protein